jgi:predicted ABC-type ATPase
MGFVAYQDFVQTGKAASCAREATLEAAARMELAGICPENIGTCSAGDRAEIEAVKAEIQNPTPPLKTDFDDFEFTLEDFYRVADSFDDPPPLLVMFSGPNGSGKSTINARYRATPLVIPQKYINADDIARTLQDEIPDYLTRNLKAAKMAGEARKAALANAEPFTLETVMSTPEKIALLTHARARNYAVALVFVSTRMPEINVARVAARVQQGGHSVDPEAIRRRYENSMCLLSCAVEHADEVLVFDNSEFGAARQVARKTDGLLTLQADAPLWVTEYLEKPYRERERSRQRLLESYPQLTRYGQVDDADASNGQSYTGKLIAATPYHALQEMEKDSFILHDRALTATRLPPPGEEVTIRYAFRHGKMVIDAATPKI